jgi:hypothetical protein
VVVVGAAVVVVGAAVGELVWTSATATHTLPPHMAVATSVKSVTSSGALPP